MAVRTSTAFHCRRCEHRWYYTKPVCPECNSDTIAPYTLDTGRVESTTTVYATPVGVRSPNRLALVRFEDVGVIAQIADDSAPLAQGDRVELVGEYTLREGDTGTVTGPRLSNV